LHQLRGGLVDDDPGFRGRNNAVVTVVNSLGRRLIPGITNTGNINCMNDDNAGFTSYANRWNPAHGFRVSVIFISGRHRRGRDQMPGLIR